jgi:hypothetical protein
VPDPEARACLAHGDVGPGNFLFDEQGAILAIIDWEVAHVGHPLEDLAAVLCRALGVSFGAAADHIANYERETGEPVDRRKLDYFVILVLTRWSVGLNLALSRPSVSQHVAVLATYRQSVAYTLVCMLARQYRVDVPALEPLPARSASAFIHEHIVETLETIVAPALSDPFVAERVRGATNLARFLRDRDVYGAERQLREEQREIEALDGHRLFEPRAGPRRSLPCGTAGPAHRGGTTRALPRSRGQPAAGDLGGRHGQHGAPRDRLLIVGAGRVPGPRLVKRARHAADAVASVDAARELSHSRSRVVELPVPLPQLVIRTVVDDLQDLRRRSLVAPQVEVLRERPRGSALECAGRGDVVRRHGGAGRLHRQRMPDLDAAVVHRRVADQEIARIAAAQPGNQHGGTVVGRVDAEDFVARRTRRSC